MKRRADDDFRDIQEQMETHIHDGDRKLSMYESLFFILEEKGIKLLTKDGQKGCFSGPEEALCYNLPDLYWSYMMNWMHGKLLVDVGISFTPHSPDVSVVGVWRLDALEVLFGAGGYKQVRCIITTHFPDMGPCRQRCSRRNHSRHTLHLGAPMISTMSQFKPTAISQALLLTVTPTTYHHHT
jgi:hypothetical protein